MRMFNKVRSIALGTLIVCSSVANAAVVEFDDHATSFTNFNFRTITDVLPGVDLTIEAAIFSHSTSLITNIDTGTSNNRRFGFLDNDGLGVVGLNTDSNTKIDGSNSNDMLIFTFSQAVNLLEIGFTDFNSSDDFEFGLVEGNIFNRLLSNEDVTSNYSLSGIYGTTFGIGAQQSNDSFKLASITFVSAPSTLAVFCAAFAVFGFRKLKRN